MDAALRTAAAELHDCIAETVGLMARVETAASDPDREAVLGELELLLVSLEELADGDEADPAVVSDADAVIRQARLLCAGHPAGSRVVPESDRGARDHGWSSAA